MARIIGGGTTTTDGEKRLIRTLKEGLPDNYLIYHNFDLPSSSGQSYEYDVMVIGTQAIYVIEDKFWSGEIKGNDTHCTLSDGAIRNNPIEQATRLAKILNTYLVNRNNFLRSVWIQDVVNYSGNNSVIKVQGNSVSRMTTLDTICDFIKDTKNLSNNFKNSTNSITSVINDLTYQFRNLVYPQAKKRFNEYQVIETKEQTELYKEYIAYNINLGESSRHVTLKEFFMDPYLSSADQQKQMRLLKRDYKALEALRDQKQIIRPRTGFEPDGDISRFIVVYDQINGRELIEWFLEDLKLDEKQIRKLLFSALKALKGVHDAGLLHRNVTPNALIIEDNEVVHLQNFEYSRLPLSGEETIGTRIQQTWLDKRYTHPSIVMDISLATKGTDVYSLGCVFYDLLNNDDERELQREHGILPDINTIQDRQLVNVIRKMSHGRVDEGYSNVDEVIEELGEVDDEVSISIKEYYEVGDKIDNRYLIEEKLGSGGYSNVYKAFYEPADEMYAIKIMKNQRGNIETVKAEYKRLKELKHEHIAHVKDVDSVYGGRQYLLKMEYIKGKPLSKIIDDGDFTISKIVSWGSQILLALCYLQDQRPPIIHADIKPANIMIREDGKAILIDFNISQAVNENNAIGGTRRYMAPDALMYRNDLSNDTFSLGLVLYEMIGGEYPFSGNVPQLSERAKDIRILRPSLSEELSEWIMKSCQTDKHLRFSDAKSMKETLDNISVYVENKAKLKDDYEYQASQLPALNVEGKVYYNKFIPYFQSFYSQSEVGNKGTRGLDSFAKLTYVETKLDNNLRRLISSGKYKLIIITGNAGDGKTAFIQQLENIAIESGQEFKSYETNNGSEFYLNDYKIITNYDGSQDEGEKDNNQVLEEFFLPFQGDDCFRNSNNDEVRIIAINEGRLMEFLSEGKKFPSLLKKVVDYLSNFETTDKSLAVINLNWRSVVAKNGDNASILKKLVDRFINPIFFKECESCTKNKSCYIWHNVKTLQDESIGKQVKEQIRTIFELVHLRKKLHITMRDIRSALSYIIFGTKSCEEIIRRHESSNDLNSHYELLSGYYYNSVFNWHPESLSSDRLMLQLKEVDVANVAIPHIDRILSLSRASDQSLYQSGDLVSTYDLNLLNVLYEYIPNEYSDYQNETKIDVYKNFLKISKRKYYFEGINSTKINNVLPYASIKNYLEVLTNAEKEVAKMFIIKAISSTEQVKNEYARTNICIREAKQKETSVLSVRLFPAKDFELCESRIGSEEFIEYASDALELRYKNNRRIRFLITLDLYELFSKVSTGYVPTSQELRGAFINLTIFKNQLASLPYDKLIITQDEKDFFQITKANGVLYFEKVV